MVLVISQTVLALRGSDGFSRDPWRVPGVCSRSLGARSHCKNAVKVTVTFATLQRNRGSRAQTHKHSMVFVNFCLGPGHDSARQPQMLQMSAVEAGPMFAAEAGQVSAAET